MDWRRRIEERRERGEGYYLLEMYSEAIEELDEAVALGDDALSTLRLLAECHRESRNWDCALTLYERVRALDPRDVSLYVGMGWCHKRKGDLPKAIDSLRAAFRAGLREPILHYNLSCYYALLGERRKSFQTLEKAISEDPRFRELAREERDFDPIRSDTDFRRLLEKNRS